MALRNAAVALYHRADELAPCGGLGAGMAQEFDAVAEWLDQLADEEMREEARVAPEGDEQLEACRG